MADLENERLFLSGLKNSGGEAVGSKIMDAFMDVGSCIVFGPPGSGKTTISQILRVLANQGMVDQKIRGAVHVLPYDQTLNFDLEAHFEGKNKEDMTREEVDAFSDHLKDYILANKARKDTNPRWVTIADLVGIGKVNLGKTTLEALSSDPEFIFIQVIPTPPVLNIAHLVRSVSFPLASSPGARQKFESRWERERMENPEVTEERVRQLIREEILMILDKFNIVTDLDDPDQVAEAVANMGGPGWIDKTRAAIIKEARDWRDQGLIRYPLASDSGDDLQIHIAHGRYYRNQVLHLPEERTFDVVNYQQSAISWRLRGLYEMEKAVKNLVGNNHTQTTATP